MEETEINDHLMAGNASGDYVREYASRTMTEKQERVQAKNILMWQ